MLKKIIIAAAVIVFALCFYSFLLGNEVFQGHFSNDAIGWYFLAKGIFCSLALYLLILLIEAVQGLKDKKE